MKRNKVDRLKLNCDIWTAYKTVPQGALSLSITFKWYIRPLKLEKRAGSQSMLNGLIKFTYFTIAKMKFSFVSRAN